jgi:copper(I)-binding protein
MVSRSTGPLRKILPAVAAGLAALLVGCSAGQVTQTDSIVPAVNGNRGDVGAIALRDVMIAYPESGAYGEGDQAPLVLTIVNTGDTADELVSVSSPVAGEVALAGNPSLPANTRLQVIVPEEPVEASSSAPSSEPSEEPSSTEASEPGGSEEPSEPTTTDTSIPEESITEPSAPADTGTEGPPESGEATPPSEPSDSEATETPSSEPALPEVGTMSIVLVGLTQDLPTGRNVPVTFVFANAGSITIQLPIASPATARPDPTGEEEDSGH